MKYIFTGGTGLLGSTLKYHQNHKYDIFPTRKELDVNNINSIYLYLKDYEGYTLVHCAAQTNTSDIQNNSTVTLDAIQSNIIGTANLVSACMALNIKIVYISTDYVFDGQLNTEEEYNKNHPVMPVNKYGWSKLGGECAVNMYDNSLIIRTSFCESYFKYDQAFDDQWTSRSNVTHIANLISTALKNDLRGIIHIGGKGQTVYQLAKELSPHKKITKCSREIAKYPIPKNTKLFCDFT